MYPLVCYIYCRTLLTTQPHSPGATEAGDQSLGSWAGALVTSDLLPDAEVSRRAVPSRGHSVPGLIPQLIPRGGICPCFSHLLESSVHTKAVALVTSSQPRSSHKTTQSVLAVMTLPVLAKLHLSQAEIPPDPAHCQQSLSVPRSHSVWVKLGGPLGTGRWPGEEGFAPRCSSRGRDGLWGTGTAQPRLLLSRVSDFLPLCFISSRLWALG